MRTCRLIVPGLTVLGCLIALVSSVVPGVLQDLLIIGIFLFVLALFAVPVLSIMAVIGLFILHRKGRRSARRATG